MVLDGHLSQKILPFSQRKYYATVIFWATFLCPEHVIVSLSTARPRRSAIVRNIGDTILQMDTNGDKSAAVHAQVRMPSKQGGKEEKMARLAGIEPATLGFGGQYSIH